MARENTALKTKDVTEIVRTVTVGEFTSELGVQLVHNAKKNTFSITSKITTKQVSLDNEEVNAAVVKQVASMLTTAVNLARAKVQEHARSPETNQLEIFAIGASKAAA